MPSGSKKRSDKKSAEIASHPIVEAAATSAGVPIVGIGASAGGLAAFEAFFSGMPADADTGAAFVLVQHLAPDHKSILAELVRRYTRMQVFEVVDGMKVQPNCTYIIPPNRDMAFLHGALTLLGPSAPRGLRLPVDFFFRSLALDQRDRAICIVLSGTGSDGTLGVRAIKGEGGMVMAQTLESTEYNGMPRSAIDTGLVDYVLPPAEMPRQLMLYIAHAFGGLPRPAAPATPVAHDGLQKVFVLLRSQTGHDFTDYKRNTILRRIERRMAVHQIDLLDAFVRYLQQTPSEVDALFRDLLIGVTNFFRDPEAFATLEKQAIPQLFDDKPAGATIRVWVPGCSTGEEAYSIAILLQERMEALKRSFKVQVFATDIDSRAVGHARAGVYPTSIVADVNQERLGRFFAEEPQGDGFRVHKNIRDLLVFSEQNVIKDPPFSKLDLISCRNLLIYLGGELQKNLILVFHYALKPGGLLFLGTSETVGEAVDLYATVDRAAKLYKSKGSAHSAMGQSLGRFLGPYEENRGALRPLEQVPGPTRTSVRELTERALLQYHAPAGALVDARGDILYLHGRTGQFLEPAPGDASLNILKMAREGLRAELPQALHRAVEIQEPVCRPGLRVRTNGDFTTVDLTVRPLAAVPGAAELPNLFLAVFELREEPSTSDLGSAAKDPATNAEAGVTELEAPVAALRRELRDKEEYLQSINEELETSNEELKSTNEEMQSVNEELQSTNEEMETSKEELQSVNEELATVNAELQQKVVDLSRANNDMNNLLAGTGIGTIFVDHQLRTLRFTPTATQVINLIPTDVGRPLSHIVSNLVGYEQLVEDVRGVLDTLIPRDIEVQTKGGAWYSLRIRAYRTLDNVIEGAVITFTDITELRLARSALQQSEGLRRLAVVVRDSRDAVIMHDLAGGIMAWNPGAERMYGWSEAEALTMNIRDVTPQEHRKNAVDEVRRLGLSEVLEPHRTQRLHKDKKVVDVYLTATALLTDEGQVYAIATTERAVEGVRS
jgi:two-component system CheB/CheR fusion protein